MVGRSSDAACVDTQCMPQQISNATYKNTKTEVEPRMGLHKSDMSESYSGRDT